MSGTRASGPQVTPLVAPDPGASGGRPPVPEILRRGAWYLHRLQSMPLEEVPFRAAEQVRRANGRRRTDATDAEGLRRTATGLAELVRGWSARPGTTAYWASQAHAVSGGLVTVFGHRWPTTADGTPDWDVDPVTGYRWPQDYCFDVPLAPTSPSGVEVKHVWELNRLLYLLPVAAQAATGDDDRLRALCRRHLDSWISSHPARRGVTWRSGIELAMRILAFVVVLELTSDDDDPQLDRELETRVGRAVVEHVSWIRQFPSRYSSANNHRVAELAGLLIATSAYPQLADADHVDRWWSDFDDAVRLQFHPDGVPAEQATMYGVLVLEWVAICAHLRGHRARGFSSETRQRVRAAAGFLAAVTDGGGHAVRIGDSDDSRLLSAALPMAALPRTVAGLVATATSQPPPEPPRGLGTYAEGGYTTWRSGSGAEEILWVLDHGDLGMGRLAAHAHADTLAVYLHLGGRPVLVDAGTYLYHAAEDWRDRLRGTAEHNTVALGTEDSSVIAGPFNWRRGQRAVGRLVTASSGPEAWCVETAHSGYLDRYGVVHRRYLEGRGERSFAIRDRLEGGPDRVDFRWSLLLAPGLEAVPTANGWTVRADGAALLSLDVAPRWRSSATVETAWCSEDFGRLEPASRLVIEGTSAGTTSIDVELTVLG